LFDLPQTAWLKANWLIYSGLRENCQKGAVWGLLVTGKMMDSVKTRLLDDSEGKSAPPPA
jgi:hypothetical protein